jgi:hypothetical protein
VNTAETSYGQSPPEISKKFIVDPFALGFPELFASFSLNFGIKLLFPEFVRKIIFQ